MTKKITYSATSPDGAKTVSRKSARTYTHAIFARNAIRDKGPNDAKWGIIAFCGNNMLASKTAARWRKAFHDVCIVEVFVSCG